MEIERKFLIAQHAQLETLLDQLPSHQLIQYYVKVGPEEERYRKQDNLYLHTIKKTVDSGLQREEIESACTEGDFEANKRYRAGNIIEKTRYIYPYGKYKIEIDVYAGSLKGLIVGEVEFKTKDDADSFVLPDFLGVEITLEKKYKNQSLALNGLPT